MTFRTQKLHFMQIFSLWFPVVSLAAVLPVGLPVSFPKERDMGRMAVRETRFPAPSWNIIKVKWLASLQWLKPVNTYMCMRECHSMLASCFALWCGCLSKWIMIDQLYSSIALVKVIAQDIRLINILYNYIVLLNSFFFKQWYQY